MSERWILHADMDAFYASVEQRDDPSLRGKPVIIGATSARGVVSAASYEARKFGVRSAMPGFRARELCPEGVFLRGDMKKYSRISKQVHAIFADYTDRIEPLALDEAFLDIGGSVGLFGEPNEIGKKIKARVREELDLVISVGIAPNKLVAKIACTQGKPDGLLWIQPDGIRRLMNPLPVRALWGVGPKAEAQLKKGKLTTIRDIADATIRSLRPVFGEHAESMRRRAQGLDDREVESERTAKSIGEEATFSDNVTDLGRITGAITTHAEAVASRARRAEFVGKTVTLKVKLAKRKNWGDKIVSNHELFPVMNRRLKLAEPTCDGSEIRRAGLKLWKKMGLDDPIRLLGITLSDLSPKSDPRQMSLFDSHPPEPIIAKDGELIGTRTTKAEALGSTLDAISDKFGEDAIGRAVEHVQKIAHSDRLKVGKKED